MKRLITRSVFIHHSVTPQDWGKNKTYNSILKSHLKRGIAYDGEIAYHFLIGKDWEIITRPVNTVGYHSGSWLKNLSSVAICVVGNFNDDKMTKYQEERLIVWMKHLFAKYQIDKYYLHKEVKSTACPGANVTRGYIDNLLESVTIKDMNEQKEKEYKKELFDAEQTERNLNTEIGRVTKERDTARNEKDEEIKAKQDLYKKWQKEIERANRVEELLDANTQTMIAIRETLKDTIDSNLVKYD